VLASQVAVDPLAESSFEAPQRLLSLLGLGLVALLVFGVRSAAGEREARSLGRSAVWVVVLAGGVFVAAAVSAFGSPHSSMSLDALRGGSLLFLAVPLGASVALEGAHGVRAMAAFLAGATVNAVLSLLQMAGAVDLFALERVVGRSEHSALLGNEGQVALLAAFGALTAFGLMLGGTALPRRVRVVAAGIALLLGATALAHGSLTALSALASGTCGLLLLRYRRRALLGLAITGALAAVCVAAVPPLRSRVAGIVGEIGEGRLDAATSHRLGGWAAAIEMARERPLLGYGPGTFGAEFATHRVRAEERYARWLGNPHLPGSYLDAHNEPLQAAAELGIPAAIAALAASLLLLCGLAKRGRGEAAGEDAVVAAILFGLCLGAAVAALSWFPLRREATALPILLAAGRAWRLLR
jgi:O-antigen ligase